MNHHDEPDPALVELVTEVTNRFGVHGLETMIRLADESLDEAEHALAALGDADRVPR